MNAARTRQHSKILNLVGCEQKNDYPVVKYHKSCRAMFTLKRNLDQLTKDPLEPKDKRCCFREKGGSTSNVFFVERRSMSKIVELESNSCTQFRTDDKVRKASILKNDTQILAICTGELIAKEAKYHAPCYRSYTLILYKHENPVAEKNDTIFNKLYNAVKVALK